MISWNASVSLMGTSLYCDEMTGRTAYRHRPAMIQISMINHKMKRSAGCMLLSYREWLNLAKDYLRPGPWFNMKMTSYQYRKSYCRDKTVVRSSYLHNGISYALFIESAPRNGWHRLSGDQSHGLVGSSLTCKIQDTAYSQYRGWNSIPLTHWALGDLNEILVK